MERHGAPHGYSGTTYLIVFVALLVLLALTVVVAGFDLGPLNIFAAMAIAAVKAALVVLYFMQAKRSTWIIKVYAGAAVVWLMIATVITFADYVTRSPVISETRHSYEEPSGRGDASGPAREPHSPEEM